MLLKTLIATEITNEHVKKIEMFLDESNGFHFDLDFLNHFLGNVDFKPLVDWILSRSSYRVVYECEDCEDQVEFMAKEKTDHCCICGNKIEDESLHEYRTEYKLSNEDIELLRNETIQYYEDKYLLREYEPTFELLRKEREKLIPFLGSGISVPLGLPNWKQLLEKLSPTFAKEYHRDMYNDYTSKGDLLKALDHLKEWSIHINTDDQLKEAIIKIIESELQFGVDEEKHNFYDIIRLNSNLYITTNYDLCLEEFLSHTVGYRAPLCLRDIDNLRTLLEESSQVLHIHGHIKRKDTMIVSQEDYKKLYEDSALMFKVNSILANRPLLYIGFSFTDKFFVDLYTKLGKIVKNHHYIVIANPDLETARKFNKKNIKVVGLRVAETPDGETDYNDFIMAFRTLVNYIVK
jgi:hypothetical protein